MSSAGLELDALRPIDRVLEMTGGANLGSLEVVHLLGHGGLAILFRRRAFAAAGEATAGLRRPLPSSTAVRG